MRLKVGDRVMRLERYSYHGIPATVRQFEPNPRDHGGTLTVDFDNGPQGWSGYADRFVLRSEAFDFEMDA